MKCSWLWVVAVLAGSLLIGIGLWAGSVGAKPPTDNIDVIATGNDTTVLPGPPTNFDAVALSQFEVEITWTKGTFATYTLIKRQIGSYPATRDDGVEVYWGTGNSTVDGIDMSFLDEDVYYRAWSWNTNGWSLTYAQDVVEVTGAMTNAMVMFGVFILGLGLTFGGYWSKRWPIVVIACLLWFGFAAWSYSNSSTTFDIYWFIAAVCAMMGLVTAIEPLIMRDRIGTEVEKSDEELVAEQTRVNLAGSGLLRSLFAEQEGRTGKRRRQRRRPEDDEDDL